MTASPLTRDTGNLGNIRDRLTAAGYCEGSIRELLAVRATSPFPPVGHTVSLARLALGPPSPLRTLTRLLLLGQTVATDGAQLPTDLVDMLVGAGLIERSCEHLRPLVRVTPFHDRLLVGDLLNEDSTDVATDAVENPHGPTDVLARLIPRDPVARSLDIGTGSGAHALQLASHSRTALGVDISPRAVDFARFNASINEITNVQFELADVVEGLAHEEPFDLIVSNPPYLVSPETSVVYRDGPPEADHVGTRVLTQAPSLLSPDGLLVCLTSWGVTDVADPARQMRQLARQAQCDGLALVYARRTPLDNALRWNAYRDRNELEQTARTWIDFYRQRRIHELAYGIVILTPTRGQPWFRTEHVNLAGQAFDGGQVRDIISALNQTNDGHMPTSLFAHADHEITSVGQIGDQRYKVREQLICSTRGIRLAVECGPRLLDRITRDASLPPSGPDNEAMATMVRRLYELGFLVEGVRSDDR